MTPSTILTIAGSDPSGGAGVQKDLFVFRDLGLHGVSVITALTAQGHDRFFSLNAVSTVVLMEQLRALIQTFTIQGVKIGALATRELAYQISRYLEREQPPIVIVDPVLKSSSGGVLLESGGVPILTQCIFPLATLVTPNLEEAQLLTDKPVETVDDMERAAQEMLNKYHLQNILVTGGHLKGDSIDVFYDGKVITHFEPRRQGTIESGCDEGGRGTGCLLSSAIASHCVLGKPLQEAITYAKRYVEGCLASPESHKPQLELKL